MSRKFWFVVFTPEEWKKRAWPTVVVEVEHAEYLDPLENFTLELEKFFVRVIDCSQATEGIILVNQKAKLVSF